MNGSSFEQTWIPFTQGCFVPNLVEIGPVVLEKKIFKFRQSIFATLIRKAHLSLCLRWTKQKSNKNSCRYAHLHRMSIITTNSHFSPINSSKAIHCFIISWMLRPMELNNSPESRLMWIFLMTFIFLTCGPYTCYLAYQ